VPHGSPYRFMKNHPPRPRAQLLEQGAALRKWAVFQKTDHVSLYPPRSPPNWRLRLSVRSWCVAVVHPAAVGSINCPQLRYMTSARRFKSSRCR
jgi:hypothetical protein